MPSFSADPFVPTSYRDIVGWWSAVDPTYYVSETSVSPVPTAFASLIGISSVTAGIADPFGGTGAYRITENSSNSQHGITADQADFTPTQTEAGDL
jgi:hypothetical protein